MALGVEMGNDKFKKMTDEQLVAATNSRLWISGEEGQAAAELYKRQKLQNGKNFQNQKWILFIAIVSVIIAAITLAIVSVQFFQYHNKTKNNYTEAQFNCAHPDQATKLNPSKTMEKIKH